MTEQLETLTPKTFSVLLINWLSSVFDLRLLIQKHLKILLVSSWRLLQASMEIKWHRCGTSHAILTCLSPGVRWIPYLIEAFYTCVAKIVSRIKRLNITHVNNNLSIFWPLPTMFYLLKSTQSTARKIF